MDKENLEKMDLYDLIEESRECAEAGFVNFGHNSSEGGVLYLRGGFRTAQETLLAKCFYCQALKHHGELGECPDIECPLYRFMREKRYRRKNKVVYP